MKLAWKTPALKPAIAVLALTAVWLSPARAQGYPTRPITMVIPFAAGGPTDLLGRSLAQAMSAVLNQSVVVENRPGAGGTLASAAVARAQPDGYTVLLHHIGMSTAPALYRKLNFNPLQAYEYIGHVADVPMTVVGRPDLPPITPKEFIAYMKANGSKVNIAHAGLGAASHLCGMLLQQAIGSEATTVPYQDTGPAMTGLMGKQVDAMCDQTMQTMSYIKAGKVKFYGVTTKERLRQLPDAPTMREAGLKDFEVVVWHGVYAPKGTPPNVTAKLNEALQRALQQPALVKRLDDLGVQIVAPALQTPKGLQEKLSAEITRWGPLIREAGTYAD
ncbi:tripartite tricarboxylate transporter substrate-binding protein [Cupriavidus sp. LEh25]|uniref:tripartite tricarboxylate transporter substrate-binding protein n=1 Tax=Cupriavidus consociatus TaxID=2821357 RepID=UPI001AEB03CF|nr:tripartite tricarboxylate transporter substrate binding protein BugD [Cupriavidus sp. LEh25]